MGSVPVARAGMGSASNDLQRDFGGALFQAVMGTLLAVEYTHYFTKAFASLPPSQAQQLSQQAAATISQSFTGAEQVAKQFPQAQAEQLIAAAQQAFVAGKTAAILFAVIASTRADAIAAEHGSRWNSEALWSAAADGASPTSAPTSARRAFTSLIGAAANCRLRAGVPASSSKCPRA